MGFWAEEWWQSFVCERSGVHGGDEVRATVLRMLRASLGVLICMQPTAKVTDRELVAAEAVFELLGCARDFLQPEDALCCELLEGLVFACGTAVARCHKHGPDLAEHVDMQLAITTLRCLGRMATESTEALSEHLSCVAPTVFQAMRGAPSAVSEVAVEFWSSLALQEVADESSESYTGDGVVAEFIPQLSPILLKMIAASMNASSCDHRLGESACICLQLLVKIDEDGLCVHQLCQFLFRGQSAVSQRAIPGCGDLLALEALLESSSQPAAEAVKRFCPLLSAAMSQSSLQTQAAKTATRALQTHVNWIPETVKEGWLQSSLSIIQDVSSSFEFGHLLQELMTRASATPQQFDLLARQLFATFEEVPASSPARPALLRALAALIESSHGCEPSLRLLLSQFLGALQRCHHIDGAGSCLKALILGLGPCAAEFADRLLELCSSSSA